MSMVRRCKITNRYGFHVRPAQRFSQLANAFLCDVKVTIGKKTASGKSIFHLISLGGRHGLEMTIETTGADEEQAMKTLGYLVDNQFFVEDEFDKKLHLDRHYERLAAFASAFRSRIEVAFEGKTADAKNLKEVIALGFMPWEKPTFAIEGLDHRQASSVLETVLNYNFFVEEDFTVEANRIAYRAG